MSADYASVAALLHRYARAVDTKDWALYRSVFTDDARIDYSSNGIPVGSLDEVTSVLSQAFAVIPMTMHYITNIEVLESSAETAVVRATFYNPMQLPGRHEMSSCGGYYHHELVLTDDGWRSRHLREEGAWFINPPVGNLAD